jgi:hypothetical protein
LRLEGINHFPAPLTFDVHAFRLFTSTEVVATDCVGGSAAISVAGVPHVDDTHPLGARDRENPLNLWDQRGHLGRRISGSLFVARSARRDEVIDHLVHNDSRVLRVEDLVQGVRNVAALEGESRRRALRDGPFSWVVSRRERGDRHAE